MAASSHAAIAVHGIRKHFAGNLVLDGISLDIAAGEVVALMGANGAGKSTLVKILSGALEFDTGTIALGGRPIRLRSPAEARAAGIVPAHQVIATTGVPTLSVAENLLLDGFSGSLPLLLTPRRLRQRAAAIAAEAGLVFDLSQPFDTLGLADRQLVAIARALAAEPKLLILDEPTASLSAAEAERLFAVIDQMKARGVAILFISHRLGDIRRIADRILVLRNGRMVGEFTPPLDLAAAATAMIGQPTVSSRQSAARPAAEPVLRLCGLRLRPQAPPIDLDLLPGEVTVLSGPLGAGKTSLLEILFGLRPPAAGTVTLAGRPWQPRGPAAAIAGGVFMTGEDRWRSSLMPAATPGADIAGIIALPHLGAWTQRFGFLSRAREHEAAWAAIRRLGIVCRGPADSLETLSGGNQQKVVAARWQARPCRLLLLDEPFQGVDLGARHDLIAALRAMDPATVIVIATNDMEEALEAADRILVLRDRAIVAEHRPSSETAGAGSLVADIARLEAALGVYA